jgi:O-antigen/teichoic acid export membrane protein
MPREAAVAAPDAAAPPASARTHARHLAIGTLAQQGAQIVVVLVTLVLVTLIARRLTVAEFGLYGLILSFGGYFAFAQGSVEVTALKAIAEARDELERDRAYTTALVVYSALAVAAALLIVGGGLLLLRAVSVPQGLHSNAELAVVALALVTLVGWPSRVFRDVLRGSHLFALSAVAEAITYVLLGGAIVVLLELGDPPIWLLVGAVSALPQSVGIVCWLVGRRRRPPYHFRTAALTTSFTRNFASTSTLVLIRGLAGLIVYSLDRLILVAFRPVATVGLYEAAVRPHNLIRQLQGQLVLTVQPASSRYLATDDTERTRQLLLRGSRYVLAAIAPFTIVFMVLPGPILDVWLGPRYAPAAAALAILVSYWLVAASTLVPWLMVFTHGGIRVQTWITWLMAFINLALSLALTPVLGLNGVVLGTTIGQIVIWPITLRVILRTFPVTVREYVSEAWLPAYSTGVALAAALALLRYGVGLHGLVAVAAACVGGVLSYFAAYYLVWLSPGERALVRNLVDPRGWFGRARAEEASPI